MSDQIDMEMEITTEAEGSYANELLNARENTHGDFKDNARFAQNLKEEMRDMVNWKILSDVQRESLDHIATKMGRVLSGDTISKDSWDDIAGYANLVSERL